MQKNALMKPVTIYFQEAQYLMYQELAKQRNKKAAELIREAMSDYLEKQSALEKKHSQWQPVSLGGLKEGGDWINKDYEDELLGAHF